MAKRIFKLPGIQDLSKEQEEIRALPLDGQHLIVGGPGTGKSVMALLRAKKLQDEGKPYNFLVYNHLLDQANTQLFDSSKIFNSKQWQSWFFSLFRKATKQSVPMLPRRPDGWQDIDWVSAKKIITSVESYTGTKPYLVIDEGQDMPPEFYECIVSLGYENIFVVADQNQAIIDGQGALIKDLQDMLGLDENEIIKLETNYRNNYGVAKLASEFFTDPVCPLPNLPDLPQTQSNIPLLVEYSTQEFDNIIQRILTMAQNNQNKLLGLIAPDNKSREYYYNSLIAENDRKELEINIVTYHSQDRKEMKFDEGGIMVINCQACKGLEFDTVFVIGLNNFQLKHEPDFVITKKLFYVMIARAIDRVIMLSESNRYCPVEAILPQDTSVLERQQ